MTSSAEPLVGYDLDGVLCDPPPPRSKPYRLQTGAERQVYEQVRRAHYRIATALLKPEDVPYVVITGRKERWRADTLAWLEAHGLRPVALYMNRGPRTRQAMIAFKAEVINRLGLARFHEDDATIVRRLSRLCPGCAVILVASMAPESLSSEPETSAASE